MAHIWTLAPPACGSLKGVSRSHALKVELAQSLLYQVHSGDECTSPVFCSPRNVQQESSSSRPSKPSSPPPPQHSLPLASRAGSRDVIKACSAAEPMHAEVARLSITRHAVGHCIDDHGAGVRL